MKLNGVVDWIVFLPWLLVLIPIIVVPAMIGSFIGFDGTEIAGNIFFFIIKMGLVVVPVIIFSVMAILPWCFPCVSKLTGWIIAIVIGSWLSPLGIYLLFGFLPVTVDIMFGATMQINPKPFVIGGMISLFSLKLIGTIFGDRK